MQNDFNRIKSRLNAFAARVEALEFDAHIIDNKNVREADFKAKLVHSTPIRYERRYLDSLSTPRDEIARQTLLVNCCIDQMQTAITLIDAQLVHWDQNRRKVRRLKECHYNDLNAVENLQGRVAGIVAGKFTHIGQYDVRPKNFDARMKEIDRNFAPLQAGIPTRQMETLRPAQIKKKIFDMRVDFAEAVCFYTDLRLQGAETLMEDAVNIKTAMLRGVFKSSDTRIVSEQLVMIKAERAAQMAREARGEIQGVNTFLKHLHNMLGDTVGAQKTGTISHYWPVTIRGLVSFVA